MRLSRRGLVALGLIAALGPVAACSKGADDPSARSGGKKVEVFSWWTGAGEQEGLAAMVADFKKNNPGVEFVNGAVSGGAGANARVVLGNRLQANDPPDSYQSRAGLELQADIKAGKVEDLTSLYDRQGWKGKFPKSLLDAITIDGKIYAVPVNIHRANLMWYQPATLRAVGISAPPKTWSEFLTQAEQIKAKGKLPLAIGPLWAQKHLLETVLLGELGADGYTALWNGKADWRSAPVIAALDTYQKVLSYSDLDPAVTDWQSATDKVLDGSAVYTVTGDWNDGYLGRAKKLKFQTDYDVVATPGSEDVYDFLSDSFTLAVGAKDRAAAEKWLIECGSTAGQDAFNPRQGSIPARTDADRSKYPDYLALALKTWQDPKTRIVGSLAHGVVANRAVNAEIDTGLSLFTQDRDSAKFAAAVATAYQDSK